MDKYYISAHPSRKQILLLPYFFEKFPQLKRLELKLKQFAEMETMLMKECEQVERVRQRIAAERALIVSTHFGSPRSTGPGAAAGPSMVNNITGNNRPQAVPGAPSQPSISG